MIDLVVHSEVAVTASPLNPSRLMDGDAAFGRMLRNNIIGDPEETAEGYEVKIVLDLNLIRCKCIRYH